MRLHLAPLEGYIAFRNCPGAAEGLAKVLRGWESQRESACGDLLARIERRRRSYVWMPGRHGAPDEWKANPPETDFDVVCELQFELVDWLLARHPRHFYLHCAAVEGGQGLVAFPSPRRAGKSTLTLQLAMAGFRVFADDALPVEADRHLAIAPGILPRLRLPIARATGRGFREFIGARPGPADVDYRYIRLKDAELAPFGAKVPIHALVVLDRVRSGPASLLPVGHAEMLKLIIARNAPGTIPAMEIFDRFHAITAEARRFRLTYSDGEEAADLLKRNFAE